MANKKIIMMMLCSGVSIADLADELVITDDQVVDKLNNKMGYKQSFEVIFAIAEIANRRQAFISTLSSPELCMSVSS